VTTQLHRVLAVLIPILGATMVCVWWTRAERLVLSGDEPHYLIMARSVMLDGDFALWNNYQEDALTGEIYGPITPHAYTDQVAWLPYHSVGLALLLAGPFRYVGLDGVRLTLIAFSALLPLSIALWLPRRVPLSVGLLLACSMALSVPFGYGAFRVYPDLPAASIVTAAVLLCVAFESGTVIPLWVWIGLWTLVGFLPWLQSRFLATWALLVGAGVVLALGASAARRRALLIGVVPAIAGVAALCAFNLAHYGSALGPPRWHELTRSPARAVMVFLGLHLDQSQGLFLQQPLWLLGLLGIVPFARAKPLMAAWLALVYLSIITPGAMQMGRYGGAGPVGRYAWAAAFLWIVPLAYLFEVCRERGLRWLRRAVVVTVAIQSLVALRWMITPELLAPRLDAGLAARESLAPMVLRYVLPSFYFWDFRSYWTHPPNVVAMITVVALGVSGLVWKRRPASADASPARGRSPDQPSRA
jgi:hypothetical protein